jgi:hypothetical protein
MKLLENIDLDALKITASINAFSLAKLPLLAFISPRILKCNEEQCIVRVRLGYRTRNHLNVMYFGALAMGAELSIAAMAVQEIARLDKRIDFIFKDFKCEFSKRADGHVHFICDDSDLVAQLIRDAANSPERLEGKYRGRAVVATNPEQTVMTYELTLSVRSRENRTK